MTSPLLIQRRYSNSSAWRRPFGPWLAIAVSVSVAVASGCSNGQGAAHQPSGEQGIVTVSVAASTTDAIKKIAHLFERDGVTGDGALADELTAGGAPGARVNRVRINSGPSSGMASQILSGAPADIFLSANEKWADAIADKGLALARQNLLSNRLVLIVPAGNPANIQQPTDLAGTEATRIALAGERVPAGIYADEALGSLHLSDRLSAGRRIVRGQTVRVVLGYVEQGEVAAGIVYSTDAKVSGKVETTYEFDPSNHSPIIYPIMLLKAGEKNAAAREFYEFLSSPAAAAVFEECGFQMAPAGSEPVE